MKDYNYLPRLISSNNLDENSIRINIMDIYWYKHEKSYFEYAQRGELYNGHQKERRVIDRFIKRTYKSIYSKVTKDL